MFQNRSVNLHQFSMVPKADIPRSSFLMQQVYKTTFDTGKLIPVFCEEVLPGDTFKVSMTAFARLSTPIFPIMDNMQLTSFFFFVPNRLVWSNWEKFMGEQANPGDSISYVIPQQVSPAGGYAINSLQDYFGLPTVGQVGGAATVSHSALPLRAYNLIYNEWFRDQNLINSATVDLGNGPDTVSNYTLRRRGKRHDYFTSALPWPQKGTAVSIGLTGNADVKYRPAFEGPSTADNKFAVAYVTGGATSQFWYGNTLDVKTGSIGSPQSNNLYADLSTASSITINTLRQSFQIQKLLERDARGGTRYTEIIRAHFGVLSPDARLQRPEYLGGSTTRVSVNPIAQTSGTGASGTTAALGTLSAMGTALAKGHHMRGAFTEHGYIIGLICVDADLTYQQGLRRAWSRSTRYDYYFPAFAMLGEQSILNKEIYCDGSANDALTFGYQERWAEYRYAPSMITGLFRSTAAGTLDAWHLSQKFTALPTLNQTFIESTPPVDRVVAVGAAANGKQFIGDFFFDIRAARPLPAYSVPGLIDHF